MQKILGLILIAVGMSTAALAAGAVSSPEIDATTGIAAVGLLAGAVLVIRSRRKK